MNYADTPIHELPQPEDYVKAIQDYFGTEVIVTDDIYNSKYKGWNIYVAEESMDGVVLFYTTTDTSKYTYLGNMTSDIQDLWDELESDIKSGGSVVIYDCFADELGNFDAEHICKDVWDYACDESRIDAEKKAKLNLSNIDVNEY